MATCLLRLLMSFPSKVSFSNLNSNRSGKTRFEKCQCLDFPFFFCYVTSADNTQISWNQEHPGF